MSLHLARKIRMESRLLIFKICIGLVSYKLFFSSWAMHRLRGMCKVVLIIGGSN
jgi:hypothetical protein